MNVRKTVFVTAVLVRLPRCSRAWDAGFGPDPVSASVHLSEEWPVLEAVWFSVSTGLELSPWGGASEGIFSVLLPLTGFLFLKEGSLVFYSGNKKAKAYSLLNHPLHKGTRPSQMHTFTF